MLEGKELAVAVAKKLDWILEDGIDLLGLDGAIREMAAEILFSEGMAERIDDYLMLHPELYMEYEIDTTKIWWRTITPEKILNVYLELED